MLESVVSDKTNNIGPSFKNNCNVTWFDSANLKSVSKGQYRKRYYPSTFEKENLSNPNSEVVWKRRREYINKQTNSSSNNKNNRKSKSDYYRNRVESERMTRTSCCQFRRHNDGRFFNGRGDRMDFGYQRNRSLSQSNVAMCLPQNQLPIVDNNHDTTRNSRANRHLNPTLLHQISSHPPQTIIHQGKEALATSNTINNYFNVQTTQPPSTCGLINQFPMTSTNPIAFRQPQQTHSTSQTTRRRHHTSDLSTPYQIGGISSSQYMQPHPANIITSQASISTSNISNRTLTTNTASFPFVNRSFCQNPNQIRYTTYPMNPYPSHQQTMFSRSSVTATTILPHNSAFSSTVQMPTIIGDVISSTPCNQCAIIAGSGLGAFSNLSSMFQFSVAPTPANLITLAAVSGDRIHGSRLSYMPVQTISNWHNHHHYLPAAWSYNDLSSILHNSTTRHILQDHLAQRLLSRSPNMGIQLVMMASSSVMGSNDHSQVRHHLIPVSPAESLSPIAVSRYLPIMDHIPLYDQPKHGITKQELDQIPIKKFVKLDSNNIPAEDGKDKCMICLEDFMSNEVNRLLKCCHEFHSTCVERWLKINRTCPLCRADAVVGPCGRISRV